MNVTAVHYRPGRVVAALVDGIDWRFDMDALRDVYGKKQEQHTLESDTEAITVIMKYLDKREKNNVESV